MPTCLVLFRSRVSERTRGSLLKQSPVGTYNTEEDSTATAVRIFPLDQWRLDELEWIYLKWPDVFPETLPVSHPSSRIFSNASRDANLSRIVQFILIQKIFKMLLIKKDLRKFTALVNTVALLLLFLILNKNNYFILTVVSIFTVCSRSSSLLNYFSCP